MITFFNTKKDNKIEHVTLAQNVITIFHYYRSFCVLKNDCLLNGAQPASISSLQLS